MASDKDILETIHMNIHALRLVPNYNPSKFEQNLNKLIAEHFKDKCVECKERANKPAQPVEEKSSFLGGLLK